MLYYYESNILDILLFIFFLSIRSHSNHIIFYYKNNIIITTIIEFIPVRTVISFDSFSNHSHETNITFFLFFQNFAQIKATVLHSWLMYPNSKHTFSNSDLDPVSFVLVVYSPMVPLCVLARSFWKLNQVSFFEKINW